VTETADLADRVRALPGMDRLLPALDGLPPAFLVGGAVRDLLLAGQTVDLDVAIEGDARSAARTIAERLGGEMVEHERFGTATVRAGSARTWVAATSRSTRWRWGSPARAWACSRIRTTAARTSATA
jgi:tRNA nucleotidyltransferase (CCA-adding enzyme)